MNTAQDIQAIKSKVIQAALDLAATQGWAQITMRDIAQKSGNDLATIIMLFDDKGDILAARARQLDAKVAESMHGQSMADDSHKDRLFDILMERFDIMNEDRAALVSIMGSLPADPKQAVLALPWVCRSMTWMLELAEIPTTGWQGALRIAGLSAVYIKVMRDWIKDDSADMAKTMASLDKALGHAERAAGYLKI